MIPLSTSIVDDAFQSLLFGEGSWLGLILFVLLLSSLVLKWKELCAIAVPISILLGITYIQNDLGMHCLIMFLLSAFMIIYFAAKERAK